MSACARRGSASPMALLAIGIATATATTVAMECAARRNAYRQHLTQVQAREYALGARSLPAGDYQVGEWRIVVAADRAVSVERPGGRYAIAADGAESWRRVSP